jgi:hypothetical protein
MWEGSVSGTLDNRTGALAVYVDAPGVSMQVPALIADAGERAAHATLEFFTARIPNAHTRRAYGRAVGAFCQWCHGRVRLQDLTAPTVSAYLAGLRKDGDGLSLASIKLTASAIRHWLDFLTERGVLAYNPARSVRTERLVVREGKTPVFSATTGAGCSPGSTRKRRRAISWRCATGP